MLVHQPVLVEEVLRGLALQPGAVVLDATVGLGGHAEAILGTVGSSGWLIGMDRDSEALDYARKRLERFKSQMRLIHGQFGQLAGLLEGLHMKTIDATLFDIGLSSFQLDTAERGFSFLREGPLDMRMDRTEEQTAAAIINRLSVKQLQGILILYGEERWAGRIARAIVRQRPFSSTTQLAQAIRRVVPTSVRGGTIDPATRTFQAFRIATNRELEWLPAGLCQAIDLLKPEGRIAVLAYHSLEDRIVKNTFREQARLKKIENVTRKPIRPTPAEVARNPRSRSACLRIAKRVMEADR